VVRAAIEIHFVAYIEPHFDRANAPERPGWCRNEAMWKPMLPALSRGIVGKYGKLSKNWR
jgi:hypothetical protein